MLKIQLRALRIRPLVCGLYHYCSRFGVDQDSIPKSDGLLGAGLCCGVPIRKRSFGIFLQDRKALGVGLAGTLRQQRLRPGDRG